MVNNLQGNCGELLREADDRRHRKLTQFFKKRKARAGPGAQRLFKSDPSKLALEVPLGRETLLTLQVIAVRLHLWDWKSLNAKLYQLQKANE
jgi:hypothetical protein